MSCQGVPGIHPSGHGARRWDLRVGRTLGVDEQVELLWRHQHGTCLGPFARTDHTALFEQVHEPARTGEAHLQLALEHRRGAELADAPRAPSPARAAPSSSSSFPGCPPKSRRPRGRRPPTPARTRRSEACRRQWATTLRTSSSLTNAPWMRWATFEVAGEEQHVAPADELLGAGLVEDDPAVGLARHREGDPGGDVRLDDAR